VRLRTSPSATARRSPAASTMASSSPLSRGKASSCSNCSSILELSGRLVGGRLVAQRARRRQGESWANHRARTTRTTAPHRHWAGAAKPAVATKTTAAANTQRDIRSSPVRSHRTPTARRVASNAGETAPSRPKRRLVHEPECSRHGRRRSSSARATAPDPPLRRAHKLSHSSSSKKNFQSEVTPCLTNRNGTGDSKGRNIEL
jgi:hypothetical protein